MMAYTSSLDGVNSEQLRGFAGRSLGADSPPALLRLLARSDLVELARDAETGQVIGFACAVNDDTLTARIPLLEVLPEYRGQGIGSELLRRLLARLHEVRAVELICTEQVRSFYQQHGLVGSDGLMVRRSL